MFIIHGTKRTERKLGLVADFCPICHGIRAFEIRRIGKLNHIYYIAFGQGKLVGYTRECMTCGMQYTTDPLRYAKMETNRIHSSDVDTLVHTTFPKLREEYAERLALEEQIKKAPASLAPGVRANHIMEVFRLINPTVESYYTRDTRMDKKSGIGCLGTLLLGGGLIALGLTIFEKSRWQDQIMYSAFGIFVLGGLYTIVQMAFGPGRYVRKDLLPKFARGLRPLAPTESELKEALDKCKTAGMKTGKKIKLEELVAAIKTSQAETIR